MNLLEAFNFVLRSALGFLFATAGFLAVIALENHGIEIPLDTDPLFSLLVGFAIGGFLIGGKLLTAQSRNHYILYGGKYPRRRRFRFVCIRSTEKPSTDSRERSFLIRKSSK